MRRLMGLHMMAGKRNEVYTVSNVCSLLPLSCQSCCLCASQQRCQSLPTLHRFPLNSKAAIWSFPC